MWRHVNCVLQPCSVDVYTSSISPRWPWPRMLISESEAQPGIRKSCKTLLVDSGVSSYSPVG